LLVRGWNRTRDSSILIGRVIIQLVKSMTQKLFLHIKVTLVCFGRIGVTQRRKGKQKNKGKRK
jgi:hypothetical protein